MGSKSWREENESDQPRTVSSTKEGKKMFKSKKKTEECEDGETEETNPKMDKKKFGKKEKGKKESKKFPKEMFKKGKK